MTKVVRMYVREMKAKYNKEYEQLNFDETLEEQQIQIEKEKRRQKEEQEDIQAKQNEFNKTIIQKLVHIEDNILTKKDLEYIIKQLYYSIENEPYLYFFDSKYQKTTRLIEKYNLDWQFYDDKENKQYIQYKQELEQKYQEHLNKPKKETVKVDFGKYASADLDTLVKEYHDDLTKDCLETIIPLCEDTLDDEDFNDDSSPETITQVYKNLLQYKLDLKYFNDKANPQYEKDVEINKTDIIQQYNFDKAIKGKFITTYKRVRIKCI